MSRERENEIVKTLSSYKGQQIPSLLCELLSLRRERYRDSLEKRENEVARGGAQECKKLLHILS